MRLCFVVPVYRRRELTSLCLRHLRRTCDGLGEVGIDASAVVIGDATDLSELPDLGFATVVRDNDFTAAKYNDGIQVACDPQLRSPEKECGVYQVLGKRDYRGHKPGDEFVAQLDPRAERRAIERGSIMRLGAEIARAKVFALPDDWVRADYVVPCGSDDWVDWRIFTELPKRDALFGFQRLSFVREDGREMVQRWVKVKGGCGIRIYPREIMATLDYRPADEDRRRACDTSIITNLWRKQTFRVFHRDIDPRQIVDWKSPTNQLNPYESLTFHKTFANPQDPFEALADMYPADLLDEMQAHYDRQRADALVAV